MSAYLPWPELLEEQAYLLQLLSEVAHDPGALEHTSSFLESLRTELRTSTIKLADLERENRNGFAKSHESKSSAASRFLHRVTGSVDSDKHAVELDEHLLVARTKKRTLGMQVKNLEVKAQLLSRRSRHYDELEQRLQELYNRVFDGPKLASAEEDEAEDEVRHAQQALHQVQKSLDRHKILTALLGHGDHALSNAAPHLSAASLSSSGNKMSEFAAAKTCAVQASFVVDQAKSLDPSFFKQERTSDVLKPSWLSDVFRTPENDPQTSGFLPALQFHHTALQTVLSIARKRLQEREVAVRQAMGQCEEARGRRDGLRRRVLVAYADAETKDDDLLLKSPGLGKGWSMRASVGHASPRLGPEEDVWMGGLEQDGTARMKDVTAGLERLLPGVVSRRTSGRQGPSDEKQRPESGGRAAQSQSQSQPRVPTQSQSSRTLSPPSSPNAGGLPPRSASMEHNSGRSRSPPGQSLQPQPQSQPPANQVTAPMRAESPQPRPRARSPTRSNLGADPRVQPQPQRVAPGELIPNQVPTRGPPPQSSPQNVGEPSAQPRARPRSPNPNPVAQPQPPSKVAPAEATPNHPPARESPSQSRPNVQVVGEPSAASRAQPRSTNLNTSADSHAQPPSKSSFEDPMPAQPRSTPNRGPPSQSQPNIPAGGDSQSRAQPRSLNLPPGTDPHAQRPSTSSFEESLSAQPRPVPNRGPQSHAQSNVPVVGDSSAPSRAQPRSTNLNPGSDPRVQASSTSSSFEESLSAQTRPVPNRGPQSNVPVVGDPSPSRAQPRNANLNPGSDPRVQAPLTSSFEESLSAQTRPVPNRGPQSQPQLNTLTVGTGPLPQPRAPAQLQQAPPPSNNTRAETVGPKTTLSPPRPTLLPQSQSQPVLSAARPTTKRSEIHGILKMPAPPTATAHRASASDSADPWGVKAASATPARPQAKLKSVFNRLRGVDAFKPPPDSTPVAVPAPELPVPPPKPDARMAKQKLRFIDAVEFIPRPAVDSDPYEDEEEEDEFLPPSPRRGSFVWPQDDRDEREESEEGAGELPSDPDPRRSAAQAKEERSGRNRGASNATVASLASLTSPTSIHSAASTHSSDSSYSRAQLADRFNNSETASSSRTLSPFSAASGRSDPQSLHWTEAAAIALTPVTSDSLARQHSSQAVLDDNRSSPERRAHAALGDMVPEFAEPLRLPKLDFNLEAGGAGDGGAGDPKRGAVVAPSSWKETAPQPSLVGTKYSGQAPRRPLDGTSYDDLHIDTLGVNKYTTAKDAGEKTRLTSPSAPNLTLDHRTSSTPLTTDTPMSRGPVNSKSDHQLLDAIFPSPSVARTMVPDRDLLFTN